MRNEVKKHKACPEPVFENAGGVVNEQTICQARRIMARYREGLTPLKQRIYDNVTWYGSRHAGQAGNAPVSAWLFNCIANKHADAMDGYPRAVIMPREESDTNEADMLTSVLPVILDEGCFEQTYSDVWDGKLKAGTGVYGVFWDSRMHRGLGDVCIKRVDILSLLWEPGIADIQDSRNVFHVEIADNEAIYASYPALRGKLIAGSGDEVRYMYDPSTDTEGKSVVTDWYYKKNVNGKTLLHYCKFVGKYVLFATENEPEYAEKGLYDHGSYPFVFDVLFPVDGSPAGFGYIDVGRSAQEYIDMGNLAVMRNMLANAKPRHFIRTDGSVNETEYADTDNDFVHVDGNLGQDSILPIKPNPLPEIYVNIINNKIDELKETTGNRDVSSGGTSGGVTAASAIAALQEAGQKLTRDSNKTSYRAFGKVCMLVIELIRQFYGISRCFRITGENGRQFVRYGNAGLKAADGGVRVPSFDIRIDVREATPYGKLAQNELALELYKCGFFDSENAEKAKKCLCMMDFERKNDVKTELDG